MGVVENIFSRSLQNYESRREHDMPLLDYLELCRADPTAHNLWPLEIVIAALLGLAAALVGALAGSLAARVFAARRGGGGS